MKLIHEECDKCIERIRDCLDGITPGISLTRKKAALRQVIIVLNIMLANNPTLRKEIE